MAKLREIKEGVQYVGIDERPIFRMITTAIGSNPTAVEISAYKKTGDEYVDVTSSVFPSGAASASGDMITLPTFVPLEIDDIYRVEVKFESGGSTFEPYAWVVVER